MGDKKVKIDNSKDGKGKKVIKGLLAVSVLLVVVVGLVYFFSGFSFFGKGKSVALEDLSSMVSSHDGETSLTLDKVKMTGELNEGSSAYQGKFAYSDGTICLSCEGSSFDFQVAEYNVFYFSAKNLFLVGAKK